MTMRIPPAASRMNTICGLDSMRVSSPIMDCGRVWVAAPFRSSASPPARGASPCAISSSSAESTAMKSMTPSASASAALYADASKIVLSSALTASGSRPCVLAISRRKAAASWVAFAFSVSDRSFPLASTGAAAPTVVLGDMADTWAAARMNVPADAARAPDGVTRTATGTGESTIIPAISRAESSRPPGVSSSMIRRGAPCASARSIQRLISSAASESTGEARRAIRTAPSSADCAATLPASAAPKQTDMANPMMTRRMIL